MIQLCPANLLKEGSCKGITLEGRSLLVVRRRGMVYAYENRCPHRQIPLEWLPDQFLDDSGSMIQCATHGALFLIESGECVAGPCAGQSLTAVRTLERDGIIWLQAD